LIRKCENIQKALLDLLFSNLKFSGMPKMYDCIGYNVTVMAQILAFTKTLHGVVNYKFFKGENAKIPVTLNNRKQIPVRWTYATKKKS
jgi:hypothetical protein